MINPQKETDYWSGGMYIIVTYAVCAVWYILVYSYHMYIHPWQEASGATVRDT